MKKYLVAAAVAVMVFAFAAFAASLALNDTVLAAGEADVAACDVEIVSWGAETSTGTVHFVRLDTSDCSEDEVLFASVFDADGNLLERSAETRVTGATNQVVNLRSPVPIVDVESVQVIVHTKTS